MLWLSLTHCTCTLRPWAGASVHLQILELWKVLEMTQVVIHWAIGDSDREGVDVHRIYEDM